MEKRIRISVISKSRMKEGIKFPDKIEKINILFRKKLILNFLSVLLLIDFFSLYQNYACITKS